jgi:hypothetical protein
MTEMIILSNEGYLFDFKVVAPVSDSTIQPSSAIPLPNSGPEKQLLFRFFGQRQDLSFDFVLIPSDVDLSDGTAPSDVFPSGVRSVKEQQIFLRDYVYGSKFFVYWTLSLPSMFFSTITGNIENMTFDAPPGSRGVYRTGRLNFKRGNLAGVP